MAGSKNGKKVSLVPNAAEALYSEDDMIYGNGKEYRPKTKRGGHIMGVIVNKIAEETVKKIPDSTGHGMAGNVYNAFKGGLSHTFSAGKHGHGVAAFENPIPVVNKIFQNGWSLYHLKDGTTTINSIYTIERGGSEYAMAIEKDGQSYSLATLRSVADKIQGNEARHHNEVISSGPKFPDKDVSKAKVYEELTDNDLAKEGLIDVKEIPEIYHDAEVKLFGARGGRVVVGKTAAGENIIRYEKPSESDFFNFYFGIDMVYTSVSMAAKPAEKIYDAMGAKAAAQGIYTTEAFESAQYMVGSLGTIRSDGHANPFMMEYIV